MLDVLWCCKRHRFVCGGRRSRRRIGSSGDRLRCRNRRIRGCCGRRLRRLICWRGGCRGDRRGRCGSGQRCCGRVQTRFPRRLRVCVSVRRGGVGTPRMSLRLRGRGHRWHGCMCCARCIGLGGQQSSRDRGGLDRAWGRRLGSRDKGCDQRRMDERHAKQSGDEARMQHAEGDFGATPVIARDGRQ